MAPVWVGQDRAAAVRAAETHGTHVIMDDGLQNPHVQPDLSLLVIDAVVGLGNGHILPAGPLRETVDTALQRVGAVAVVGEGNVGGLVGKPVFHAHLEPALPEGFPRDEKFFAFAGIGRPEKFYDTCRRAGLNLAGTQDFSDHHAFSDNDLKALERKAGDLGARLLTTEKDWVRLPDRFQKKVAVFPVRLAFEDSASLIKLI
jgi:tetraacyldisaccharide 4'-kinase